MKSNRIYLPVETTRRELHSRLYFAIDAANKNWEAIIAPKIDLYSKLKYLKTGHYLGKSIQPDMFKVYESICFMGHKVSAFDEEGLLSYDERFSNRRVGKKNFKILQKYFVWGKKNFDELNNAFNVNEKLFLAGNQRVDLLKSPINNFYKDAALRIKEQYGNFILYTTKFTKTNFIKRPNLNNFVDHQIYRGFLQNDHLVEVAKQSVDHETKNFEGVKVFFSQFSKNFPEKKLIIRPHPNEEINTYINISKQFDNIEVVSDHQNTNSWIAASDLLIHYNCTTGFEGFLLGVPTINFMPFKNDLVEYKLLKTVSNLIRNHDKLIDAIDNPENYLIKLEEVELEVKKYVENIEYDSKFSDNVLNILKNINFKENKPDKYFNFVILNLLKCREFLKK